MFNLFKKRHRPSPPEVTSFITVIYCQGRFFFTVDVFVGKGGAWCSQEAGPIVSVDDRTGLVNVLAARLPEENEVVDRIPRPSHPVFRAAGFRNWASFERASEFVHFVFRSDGSCQAMYGGADLNRMEWLDDSSSEGLADWLLGMVDTFEHSIET